MPRLKDIKREIQEQHRQLEFNRFELNLLRAELGQGLREALRSKSALCAAFAGGLLLGWRAWIRPVRHEGRPASSRLQALGRLLTPFTGALWSGLIKTATSYTADRISGELHEHRYQ